MDEIPNSEIETVGQRLRAERESQKMSLETVAAQTRIPVRHLAALEESEWDSLPAPAYCVGFAKNYATVLGLDRAGIADDLRAEMGGTRQVFTPTEVFEPADPKRTMPTWLIIGAVAGVILLLLALNWMRNRDLEPSASTAAETAATTPAPATPPAPVAAPAAAGSVSITALQDAWFKVREKGGASIREGVLKQGETFQVPATATAPLLDTGRPEALRITVGGSEAPAIGRPGRSVAGVSLLPADLTAAPATGAEPASPAPTSARRPAERAPAVRSAPQPEASTPPASASAPPAATTNDSATGQ